jgi:hypothetical protein
MGTSMMGNGSDMTSIIIKRGQTQMRTDKLMDFMILCGLA